VVSGEPAARPFFVDPSLGRHQVPSLLRAAGFELQTLAEVYGIPQDETVADVDWLALAGGRGWPVLMKDDRIRYRPSERNALIEHRVQAFCLTGGNLRAAARADLFIVVSDGIVAACPGHPLSAPTGSAQQRATVTGTQWFRWL